jgi:hypothetical protein
MIVSVEHHEFVTAIECRDRSRPVGVPQIEGFHQKCQDTGIHRGVIVSPKGFYSSAVTKAAHLGIVCLRLDQVKKFDWITLGAIACLKVFFLEKNCLLIPETNFKSKPSNFRLLDGEGNIIDAPSIDCLVRPEANGIISKEKFQAGERHLRFSVKMPGAVIEALDSNERRQMKHIDVRVKLRIEVNSSPIKLLSYRQEGEAEAIREAGVAPVDLSPLTGDLVFLKNPDGSTKVNFVFKSRSIDDSSDHVFRLESGSK